MALHAGYGMPTEKSVLLRKLQLDPEQRGNSPNGRRGWWISGAILLFLALAAGVAAYFLLRGRSFEVKTAVAVAPTGAGGTNAILQATGYVTARRQATVSAQITGALTEVLIEEGEHVNAGQVLARLDDTSQRAARAQAQAQLETAQALLNQYDAQLAQAHRDLNRTESLFAARIVSAQVLENDRTQVEILTAQVASQRKQIELARATVQAADVQLNYTTLRSPFAGVITAKAAQAGEIVSPTSAGGGFTRTGVGTIVDMNSLEIEVEVNEANINRIHPGQPARATLDAYPEWKIPAHVIAIIPTADRNKATVKVRIAIEQKDPRILPDMGVQVSFLEEASKGDSQGAANRGSGVLVPSSAIVERGGKNVVLTVDGDQVHAQVVTAGQTYGDLRLVEGVTKGTTVVSSPPAEMNDGARIFVKKH
jgi:RND family efflux transporter MFP subunit